MDPLLKFVRNGCLFLKDVNVQDVNVPGTAFRYFYNNLLSFPFLEQVISPCLKYGSHSVIIAK